MNMTILGLFPTHFVAILKRYPSFQLSNEPSMSHSLASREPTLDLWLEITKSRNFVIQRFIRITKVLSEIPPLLQAKMARQG
jgi:hypothetical protein